MAVSVAQFWKLLGDSRLVTPAQRRQLDDEFSKVKGAANQGNAKTLAEWLITRRAITRFQSSVLLAGCEGPFIFGGYRVVERQQEGRFSGMFQALHEPTGHPVLLEFLSGALAQAGPIWSRIVAVTGAFCEVDHPQIRRCYELVDLATYRFIVTERLLGLTCSERVAASGGPGLSEACRVIHLTAVALEHLHHKGLVHGDIRPDNIWLEPNGNVKLLCWPHLAAARAVGAPTAAVGPLLDRADYLAPELADGGTPHSSADMYALGCTFYQLLSGSPPFPGGDCGAKARRHASEAIQPLQSQGVPHQLAQLVTYMMAKNRSVRLSQMAEVARQTLPFIEAGRLRIPTPAPVATSARYQAYLAEKQAKLAQPIESPHTEAPRTEAPPALSLPGIWPTDSAGEVPQVVAEPPSSSVLSAYGRRPASTGGRHRTAVILGATAVVAVIVAVLALNNPAAKRETVPPDGIAASGGNVSKDIGESPDGSSGSTSTADSVSGPRYRVLPDDGNMLWASPTSGQPIQLRYFAPGAQIVFVARLSEILQREEGERVFRALGPAWEAHAGNWEAETGVALRDVEQLVMGLYDNGEQFPRPGFVVRLREPLPREELLERWGNPAAETLDGVAVYRKGDWSFFIPRDSEDRLFLMYAREELQEVLRTQGASPPLRRAMAELLSHSDEQTHCCLLFSPPYLSSTVFRDGRKFYFGEPRKLREAIEWMLDDNLAAVMVSLHFAQNFFAEVRSVGQLDKDQIELAADQRKRLAEIPGKVFQFLVDLNPPRYWREVAFKYPQMVEFLYQQTRVGVEHDQAVVNCVLPAQAAHNLVFGAEMALVSGTATAAGGAPTAVRGPQTLAELLEAKLDFAFGQTSLEFAMRDAATEVKATYSELPFDFHIKIIGADLQLDGITRNQQIRDFDERGKTVAQVLTSLVRKANTPFVADPSHSDQKLVWVLGPDPDKVDEQIILITTRQAATTKGYRLPDPFVSRGN